MPREYTRSFVHGASRGVVATARCLRGKGVEIEGRDENAYVLAICCNGTGHLTQAKVVADTLRAMGLRCVGVILEEGCSDKLKKEIVDPLGVPCLTLAGVQLVTKKGAASIPRLIYRGANFAKKLRSSKTAAQKFIQSTDAGFVVSCWHYALALLLATHEQGRNRVLHLAPQFALDLNACAKSSDVAESAWRGGVLALRDIFNASGWCFSIGPGGLCPPLLEPPRVWLPAPFKGRPKCVLCYFLTQQQGWELLEAVKELGGDAIFHVFSDPVL